MGKKVYLILGASSDLGCYLIRSLIEKETFDSMMILAHYHSSSNELEQIKKQCDGLDMKLFQADMSDLEDVGRFVALLKADNLIPTHIVNFCACAYHFNRLSEWNVERIRQDMTIQVYAFAEILKAFIPDMTKQRYGKIVTMLSAVTIGIPPKNVSEYVTVKYALMGLVKSIAADYGAFGININAVSPGMIETKFIKNIGRKVKEMTAESNPKHRNLMVEDVIPVILMLLSDQTEFINGSNINLSGLPE